MLRFGATANIMRRSNAATNAMNTLMSAHHTRMATQKAAFTTAIRNSMMRTAAPLAAAATSAPTSASAPTSVATKEQKLSFISGSRSWLARNRGGVTTSSSSAAGSSLWGGMGQSSSMPSTDYEQASSNTTGEVLTPAVREHLMKVYNLLAVAIGAASVGSCAMIMTPLGKMIPFWVPCFGGFVPLLWLWFKPPASPIARQGLVLAFAGLQGMAIAPIVKATAAAGVLGSALVLTGAVFAGFSAAAFLAPRASLVAFQGPLMGMFFGMFAISILNIFWPTAFAHSLVLYGGLAIFSAFIAVDTQVMIERARCGQGDVAFDALNMFTNVLQIFIRIAEILRNMSQ